MYWYLTVVGHQEIGLTIILYGFFSGLPGGDDLQLPFGDWRLTIDENSSNPTPLEC